jgi:hypothetical protein
MWKWLISFVLSKISVDQLIAYALSWLITQVLSRGQTSAYYESSKVMLGKISESVEVTRKILEDNKVEPEEVTSARVQLLKIWGMGGDSMTHRAAAKINLKRPEKAQIPNI